MTEMMDMSNDLVGSGIPFLDYRMYAERIFFPGHRESPLRRDLDVQECRRQTVEQGLVQLSNLLNSKLFLTKVVILTICVMGTIKLCRNYLHFEQRDNWPVFLLVHSHTGEPTDFLSQRPSLCGLPADSGASWQTRIFHWHPQNSPEWPGGAVRGQEPQTDAATVRRTIVKVWLSV